MSARKGGAWRCDARASGARARRRDAHLSTASRKVEKDHGVERGSAAETAVDAPTRPARPVVRAASCARRPELAADMWRAGILTTSGRWMARPPGCAGAVKAIAEASIVGTA